MDPVGNILGTKKDKCHKGLDWPEENEYYESKRKRVCHNCVNQFNCQKSNWQPKR